MIRQRVSHTAAALALCGGVLSWAPAASADNGPYDWLDRMTRAVQTTNYEGTVIRIKGNSAEALKVVHTVSDGVVRERLIAQDGDGLEIIRNGNEVHCILPDKQSVLVEEWNHQSTLFTKLPTSALQSGNEYDVVMRSEDRVAGRKALVIAVQPHDEYRYAHKVWIDTETGFPLQTQMLDAGDDALEIVKFADIRLNHEIHSSALKPTYSTENFRWFSQPGKSITEVVDAEWHSDDLPLGFRIVESHKESTPGGAETMTHIVLSDGLARISVFITPLTDNRDTESSQVGASHSFSTVIDGYRVTAIGEVPAVTVEQIASSMSRQ
ncbi:MAG: MucB/RseB C-terminal domain-containing protein [Woeseiaceae bacterium]|nr:MucB/RseB C-terminal domain-containing protein [Woeseiaceae bacterium]